MNLNQDLVFRFNTGRQYGEKGQRIAAYWLEDDRAFFVDRDRGIRGITTIPMEEMLCCQHFQDYVMHCYDIGNYISGPFDPKDTFCTHYLEGVEKQLNEHLDVWL